MREQQVRQAVGFPAGSNGVFDGDQMFGPAVTVAHGVHRESASPGLTIAEHRRRFRDRLGLAPGVTAFVDGRAADDQTRVQLGQTLTFMRKAGEKGVTAPWTDAGG